MSKSTMYAQLNERFDKRATQLRNKGYRYERIEDLQIAIFIKGARGFKPHVLCASLVMNANDAVWGDKMDEVERR